MPSWSLSEHSFVTQHVKMLWNEVSNQSPGSIRKPDIFASGSGGGPGGVGTVRAGPDRVRFGTVRALVRKLARGNGPVGPGRSGSSSIERSAKS